MPHIIKFLLIIIGLFLAYPASAGFSLNVQVDGVENNIIQNVLSTLSIEQQKNHPQLTEGWIARLHHKAINEIHQSIQPFGYYHAKIESSLHKQGDQWSANYLIEPGEPVRVTKVDIRILGEGKSDNTLTALITDFPLAIGAILNHSLYEKGKNTFLKQAIEQGYIDASLKTHDVIIDLENNTASVILYIDTGPLYRMGEIIFDQQVLSESLLERYSPFQKGAPYTTDRLFEFQRALSNSGYYSSVRVRGRRDLTDGITIPIQATLIAYKRHRYTTGVGYGTDTGVRGSLGWENRHINRRGHHLKADLMVSEIKNSLTGRYEIPIRDPRTDNITFTTAWIQDEPETSKSETLLWGISRTLSKRRNWLQTAYLNYQSETFTIANLENTSRLFIPGISWSRLRADDRINIRKGRRLLVDIRSGIGSDTKVLQSRVNGKLIQAINADSRLIFRTDLGISLVHSFSNLPASLRFFTGGDNSVRGYAYHSLGPMNADGVVIGGKHLVVGSMEYEHRIKNNFSGAIFFDAGNAFDDPDEDIKLGTGIGLRWQTPIGPIRTDFAWAISEPGQPFRFHLLIGPDL